MLKAHAEVISDIKKEQIIPKVRDHAWWIGKMKWGLFYFCTSMICILLIGTAAVILRTWVLKAATP